MNSSKHFSSLASSLGKFRRGIHAGIQDAISTYNSMTDAERSSVLQEAKTVGGYEGYEVRIFLERRLRAESQEAITTKLNVGALQNALNQYHRGSFAGYQSAKDLYRSMSGAERKHALRYARSLSSFLAEQVTQFLEVRMNITPDEWASYRKLKSAWFSGGDSGKIVDCMSCEMQDTVRFCAVEDGHYDLVYFIERIQMDQYQLNQVRKLIECY